VIMESLTRRIKWVSQHIDLGHTAVFFGFVALALNLAKDGHKSLAVVIGFIGAVIAIAGSRTSYLNRSTALTDKYDDQFNHGLIRQRRSAALYLLGKNPSCDELEDVLDFFEYPLGQKLAEGMLDSKQLFDLFHHWVRLYYEAAIEFIKRYRENEPVAYVNLLSLYDRLNRHELKERKEIEGGNPTLEDIRLTTDEIKKYLQREADLKTENEDWMKLFFGD
jgi:hypothetical protein